MTRSPAWKPVTSAPVRATTPDGFVAHHDGRPAASGGPVHAVDVAAADAAGLDADQHVARANLRLGEILQLELAV